MNFDYLDLPTRPAKPRRSGITSVHDVSHTVHDIEVILEEFNEFIDIAKIGVGTAYVMPRVKEKIACYQKHQVQVYFGGTLFEKFYHQNKLEDFKRMMNSLGVNMLEVSCGTIDINLEDRIKLIEDFKKDFIVLSEVGSKDTDTIMPPSIWIQEIKALLTAGCEYVITEGRNSGTAGIFRTSGEIRTGLVSDIVSQVDVDKLIFESPTPKSQMFFINQVGPNVNLGNVSPKDLLLLETQRLGLRNETFFIQ